MTAISKGSAICTVMNTFTVAPENLEKFLGLMVEFNENVVSKRDGYISTNLHVSADRTHVVNYTQWQSREAFQKVFMAQPDADVLAYFQKIRPLAEPHPRFYDDVFYSHSIAGA
jgi:heme-degrading monooxygenase HmoA